MAKASGPKINASDPRNKIENLVVVMMENRSFDHYLGSLSLLEGRADVEGLSQSLPTLLDSQGNPYPSWNMDNSPFGVPDPPHGFDEAHADWNQGSNDGFVQQYQTANPTANLAIPMGYYTRQTLPTLYALADNFTLCDHWFCSVLSSTWPNRKYLHSGCRDADKDTQTLPGYPGFKTTPFWDVLEDQLNPDTGRKMTWNCYFTDLPFLSFWYPFAAKHALSNFRTVLQFAEDCIADALPTVSIIDPAFSVADDHPAHDPRLGEKWLGLIIDVLTNSDSWRHTALLLLYDENGGFYDHVAPPAAAVAQPASIPEDDRLGFRVPAFVVSPYPVKKKAVKTVFDHTSLLKSINVRWGVDFDEARFGARWKTMPDIWSTCFDFTQEPLPMGTYTGAALRDLNFASGVKQRLLGPRHGFGDLLERIFILPELKALDRRPQVYDVLAQLENRVIPMKRMNDPGPG
jgi:phospholipase C